MLLLLQPEEKQRAVQLLLDSQAVSQQPGMESCSHGPMMSVCALVICECSAGAHHVQVLHWKASTPSSLPYAKFHEVLLVTRGAGADEISYTACMCRNPSHGIAQHGQHWCSPAAGQLAVASCSLLITLGCQQA